MKKAGRRVLTFVLSVILFCSSTLNAFAVSTITNPDGASGSTYSATYAAKLDNIFQGNVSLFSNTTAKFALGSYLNNSTMYKVANTISGYQCYIYAQAVYYYLFGDIPFHGSGIGNYWNNSTTVLTNQSTASYSLFANAGVGFGAYVRTTGNSDGSYNGSSGHSFIILSYDGDGITYLEGNADGNGLVRITTRTWSEFNANQLTNKGRKICHIVQYNGLTPEPECNCSTSYAGYYICTTNSSNLNIRSGHSTSHSVIGSIPSGETVYVSKASGTTSNDWAHVEYNGISGYASMGYLQKQGTQTDNEDTEVSEGIQNIVKRAKQMTQIQWTPQKDIVGWGGGITYKAGVTYTGLPYGQPVYASYVPWSTSLEGFIDAVNDSGSKMYTSYSSYNKQAPYYSIDCSAFVSWAWGLSSRQTTSTIKNFATQISTSSYENAQIGDCLCKAGSHVVLITDITYDSNGNIDGIEISESTVNAATYYCCQVTRYGKNGTKTLSQLKSKYFDDGYILYRSKTRDNVTYTHSCVVPLDGDNCSKCMHTHSYSFYVSVEPTCLQAGNRVYTCECGHSYNESIPATGHSYGGWVTTTAATCTSDGVQKSTCSRCNDVQTRLIAATGHSYTATVVDSTCTQYGYICYTCIGCGDTYTEAAAYSEWSTTKPSGIDESRIESRVEYRYCDYVTFTSYDPYLSGYDLLSSTWQEVGSGTVNYVSSWPSGFSTSHSLYATYNNSPVTGYETETDKVVETGTSTTGYIYWHWCRGTYEYGPINRKTSKTYTSEFNTFHAFFSSTPPSSLGTPAEDGSYQYENGSCCKDTYWYYPLEVTTQSYTSYKKVCTYGGWSDWTAWNVGECAPSDTRKVETRTVYRYALGELADHEYHSVVVAPTCTEQGYTTHTCANCGDVYVDSYVKALGHSYGEWYVVTDATCEKDGQKRHDCQNCDHYETAVIEAGGHEYEAVVIEPTCSEWGYTVHTCAHCGHSYTDNYVEIVDHDYQNGSCKYCGKLEVAMGDANGDGKINTTDAKLVMQYELGMIGEDGLNLSAMDVNGDGKYNTTDAKLIMQFELGMITEFPKP